VFKKKERVLCTWGIQKPEEFSVIPITPHRIHILLILSSKIKNSATSSQFMLLKPNLQYLPPNYQSSPSSLSHHDCEHAENNSGISIIVQKFKDV
jgi:hypothetical protein